MSAARTNIGRRMQIVATLLDVESRTGRGLGVVSVADRLEREKSQVSRALAMLLEAGLLHRDLETLDYTVGAGLLRLAARAGDAVLLSAGWPILRQLAVDVGERADLTVLSGTQVLTVDTVGAASTVQSVGWAGRRTPVHCTAAGRALLLDSTPARIAALAGSDPLPVAGPASPTTLADLLRRIRAAKQRGVAVVNAELDPDVLAVAAPIRDATGSIVAAIGVAGPSIRLETRLPLAEHACSDAATRLSEALASS